MTVNLWGATSGQVFWSQMGFGETETGMGLSGQSWTELEAPTEHPDLLSYMGTG